MSVNGKFEVCTYHGFRKGLSYACTCIYYLRHGSVEELHFTPTDWNHARNAAYTLYFMKTCTIRMRNSFEVMKHQKLITHCELEEAEVKAVVALIEKFWRDCEKPRVT
jgi:hypothetical protein